MIRLENCDLKIAAAVAPHYPASHVALARLEEHRHSHPLAYPSPVPAMARVLSALRTEEARAQGDRDVVDVALEEGSEWEVPDFKEEEESDWKKEAELLYRRAILIAEKGVLGGWGGGMTGGGAKQRALCGKTEAPIKMILDGAGGRRRGGVDGGEGEEDEGLAEKSVPLAGEEGMLRYRTDGARRRGLTFAQAGLAHILLLRTEDGRGA